MVDAKRSVKIIIKTGRQLLSETFKTDRISVGRSPGADFQIPLNDVSRMHFEILLKDNGIFVKDLDSVNGTFLNSSRLDPQKEYRYNSGDNLELGKKLATIKIDEVTTSQVDEPPKKTLTRPPDPPPVPQLPKMTEDSFDSAKQTFTAPIIAPVGNEDSKVFAQAKKASQQILEESQREREIILKEIEAFREKVLKETEQERQKLIHQAKLEADKIMEDEVTHALKKAERKIEEAHQKGVELINKAQLERDHLLTNAHAEAQKIFKETEDERRHLLSTARQDIQRLRAESEEKTQEIYKKANILLENAQANYRESVIKADKEAAEVLQRAQIESEKIIDAAKEKMKLKTKQMEKELYQRQTASDEKAKEIEIQAIKNGEIKAAEIIEAAKIEVRNIFKNNSELKLKTEEKIKGAESRLKSLQIEIETLNEKIHATSSNNDQLSARNKNLLNERTELEQALNSLEAKIEKQEKHFESRVQDKKQLQDELNRIKNEIKASEDKRNQEAIEMAELRSRLEAERNSLAQELQSERDKTIREIESYRKKEFSKVEEAILKEQQSVKQVRIQADKKLVEGRTRLAESLSLTIKGEVLSSLKSSGSGDPTQTLNELFDSTIKPKIEADIFSFAEVSIDSAEQESFVSKTQTRNRGLRRVAWASATALIILLCLPVTHQMIGRIFENAKNSSSAQEFAKRMEGKRNTRFIPPQSADWFPSYVDSVLYSKNYVEQKLDSKIQDKWFKEIQDRMFKEQKVPEDVVIKLVSLEAALITQLKEQKDSIHPDFIGISIGQMRSSEAEAVEKMQAQLGSEDKYKAYLEYSKAFYDQQVSLRLPASKEK